MAFNWRREPSNPYLPADGSLAQMAANSMAGYQPLTAMTPHGNGMNGYFSNDSVANQSQGFSVPNQQHGGMGQPELDGYGASLQAASDAVAQAQTREQQIADKESQIAILEKRIAENQAKLNNWNGGDVANKVAALEARKFFSQDPTSIWRWKVERDEARRIANAQNKPNDAARANALIDANNTLDSMIIDENLDTPTKNAMLSRLADVKSNLEKNGFDSSRAQKMIEQLKGNGPQTPREQAKTTWHGLQGKKDLTSAELDAAINDPAIKWDPNDLEDAKNLRDKLKKREAGTQDFKNMKNWLLTNYGLDYNQLDADEQKSWQEIWKAQK